MQIKSQNSHVEIACPGLTIDIEASRLLSYLISDTTREFLSNMIKHRLNELLPCFIEINNRIQMESAEKRTDYLEQLQAIPDKHILEYACLNRDLSKFFDSLFDQFYEDNIIVMNQIYQIYKYRSVYGFKNAKVEIY